jgi:hypothetical protein
MGNSQPADLRGLPAAYQQWRGSALGRITDQFEEDLILGLIGPVSGTRVPSGSTSGRVTTTCSAGRPSSSPPVVCVAYLQATFRGRGRGADLVCALEQCISLGLADPGRRQDDPNGEPHRPHAVQGRLWSCGRLLPPPQDLHTERLRRGIRVQVVPADQGTGG